MSHVLSSKRVLAGALLSLSLIPFGAQAQTWTIQKESWSPADEKKYSEFIKALGESKCNTTTSCLKSPANPYRTSDREDWSFWSDCGKLPYLLRAYVAAKNGLPFSYVTEVAAAEGAGGDLRYSKKGNVVVRRRDIVQVSDSQPVPLKASLDGIVNTINTGMFRFDPRTEGQMAFDFYPVKIDRKEIQPGTVIYDPNGHVAVVYKVSDDGRVHFMDAHPDGSITRSVYGEKFMRSSPGMGAGFKNWRPVQLVGAQRVNGNLIGGKIVLAPNAKIPGYSNEQYFGNQPDPDYNWKKGRFVHQGNSLGYYDFVRTRLAVGDLKYNPIEELTNGMETLCYDIKDRVAAVDGAIAAGIQNKAQPAALPNNIYGTHGEWETYSTPSRDARLKTSFRELRTQVETFVEMYKRRDPRVTYQGTNFVADLRAAYQKVAEACVISYRRSDGSKVNLGYDDVAERLFDLSFDPYHCVELRWGAQSTAELNTCRDDSTKRAWYDAEKRLRNQVDRTYDVPMGFTLDQLRAGKPGSGVATPPDTDLKAYLNSLPNI